MSGLFFYSAEIWNDRMESDEFYENDVIVNYGNKHPKDLLESIEKDLKEKYEKEKGYRVSVHITAFNRL